MTDTDRQYVVRAARPSDYDAIIAVADDWWGRPISGVLSRLFLDHFHDTSLVAETHTVELAGFVVGFLSPAEPDCAYIHFAGVAPAMRRGGLARDLYGRFFAMARAAGRTRVAAITSPVNAQSIAFHDALGFTVSAPVSDYDGPGADRVVFHATL